MEAQWCRSCDGGMVAWVRFWFQFGSNLFEISMVLISVLLLDWCGFDFAGFCCSFVGFFWSRFW